MIAFLIALLLTLSTGGNACELGQSVDWYAWEDAHKDAKLVFTLAATDTTPDIWLYNSGEDYVLFVFKNPIDATLHGQSGVVHGQCSRNVSGDIQS